MNSIFKSSHAAMNVARTFAMVLAIGACTSLTSTRVHAQETSATIFGAAPAGQTVTAQGNGIHRHATANAKGRYTIGHLQMGSYIVQLEKDGKPVDTRKNINLTVGRGAEIDFACEHDQCAAASN